MMNMVKKNKILFIVAAIVLLGGVCLAVVLISHADVALAAQQIKTAEAEAAESAAVSDTVTPTPQPAAASAAPQATAVDTALNAEALGALVQLKEIRRDYIIPSLDNSVINEADTWKAIEPDNIAELKDRAYSKAADLAMQFFNCEITDTNLSVEYYTDTSKNRDDFIKVSTSDEKIVCVLNAAMLELIEIDYYLTPANAQSSEDFDYKNIPDSDRQIAGKAAAALGTTVSDMRPSGGGGGRGIWTKTYDLTTDSGKLAKIAIMNGELYAIGVYPSEASMQECVYFDADVQRDDSMVELASPQDFKKGEPGAGDMTKDDALKMYMAFLTLANGDGEYDQPKMTFYIDKSGARENYWHMESKKLTMDVASKSKWIISLTCDNLWNASYDLTKVEYASMGGKEYEVYVKNIMSDIYGTGLKEVSANAVYDDHYCTEDAWMADGSVYEFMFEDGKLQQVWFYSSEDCFRGSLSGWKADNEYVNSTTGETFIPQ
jgi:hypothetical protein